MKKVSKTKIALTYANALYAAAEETKAVDAVFNDVKNLSAVVKQQPEIVSYLANPIWDDKSKEEALADICRKLKTSAETLRCLKIISENRRFKELPQILEEFVHIYYHRHQIEEVKVESVYALDNAQMRKLNAALENLLGGKVTVDYQISPELIGGLRIKYGSTMIDNSIASKLNRLEMIMKGE